MKSHSPEQTQLLGSYLGKLAQRGDIFLLVGDLGTGKTCLVQGIAYGLGIKEYAFSPSFVIIREYHGRLPLFHVDFYRLGHVEEIANLGLEEYLYGEGICAVEWAEKGIRVLPQDSLLIQLSYVPTCEIQRVIVLKPEGQRYLELIKQLKSNLNKEGVWS
ncbi:MAG TPA: tRNA (adenosine(37)-N6)-threonylcarbamoyltransferase complex ATPase subunit type 1 TsaE [Dehalococcoidia bacterium]|nr:tRNA (adenosine(37)-N6)-threonylcarbamoyltransferase complex ATPase subunit type 1 TsaE [Dehalococcoidia bacterium]